MVSKKDKKTIFVVVLIAIVLVSVLAYNGLIKLPFAVSGVPCSGGQVLSVDSVNIRDSAELGKKVIRVVFSTISTGECLDIKVEPSTIETKLKEAGVTNFDAQKSIIGDINLIKKQKAYSVQEDQSKKFRKIGLKSIDTGIRAVKCTQSKCSGVPNTFASVIVTGERGFGSVDCYCVYDNEIGVSGQFLASEQLLWDASISIDGSSATLSNSKLSAKIGDMAFIKWAGNLQGNNNLGSISKETIKPYSDNQFRMLNSGTYATLLSKYNTNRKGAIDCDTFASNCNNVVSAIRTYNSQFDESIKNRLNEFITQEPLVGAGTAFDSNKLIINLESAIVYPTFTLDIDAKEVGIFITKGKPDVSCPSNLNNLVSGATTRTTFTLKNIGDNSGSFTYSLDCNTGSQSLQPTPPIALAKDATKDISAYLGLTVESGTKTATCRFSATELNTLVTDSCSFAYTATKQNSCIADTKTCEADNSEVWTCNRDGTYSKQKCSNGCEAFGDSVRCRSSPLQETLCQDNVDNDQDGLVDAEDPDCKIAGISLWQKIKNWFSNLFSGTINLFMYVKYAIIAIASILGIFAFYDLLSQIKSLKRRSGIRWSISILLAVLLGGFLFYFIYSLAFWAGVIGFVIIYAFSSRIKSIIGR